MSKRGFQHKAQIVTVVVAAAVFVVVVVVVLLLLFFLSLLFFLFALFRNLEIPINLEHFIIHPDPSLVNVHPGGRPNQDAP